MKELNKINDKNHTKLSDMNVIIYGSIRNIENDFFTSFLNLDILSEMFNEVYIIIFENDSTDKTRELLQEWYNISHPKIKKHLILKNNLDNFYPLRAHRLAYCRNCILNYIVDNNLHHFYEYAIHCDLDDRFWSINFDSIKTCFQYDSAEWDVMTCVNKNRSYYDFWALRCDKSWFNINIFSCNANNIDYNTKISGFENLLKNTSGLISTTSSFNGLGIYKVSSLINCRYNAKYECSTCNGSNRGCWEDNDHIGLHKQIVNNNGKIFINNLMFIQTRPENCMLYKDFINSIQTIPTITKSVLQYLLIYDLIDKTGKWLMVGMPDGDEANIVSNYCSDNLYVIDMNNITYHSYINKNIVIKEGQIYKCINDIQNECNKPITFLYVNFVSYSLLIELFHNIYNKIAEGAIIVFNKLINFKNYWYHNLKAFYEFLQEYKIKFEWLYVKDGASDDNQSVAIRITQNTYLNTPFVNINYSSQEYESFDWIFYSNKYNDLNHLETKDAAYFHWINYGQLEGRICVENNDVKEVVDKSTDIDILPKKEEDNVEIFDWETYIQLNNDLKMNGMNNLKDAYNHWINYGKYEGRTYTFDWCTYVKKFNLIGKSIDTKDKAIEHWLKNGRPDFNNLIDYEEELFDWEFYLSNHTDLSHIKNKEQAWNHWIYFGKKEGRKTNSFNWTSYLLANSDLIENGVTTEAHAVYHWINHGKKENRKMC